MWKESATMSGRSASLPSMASAGGHELQPCEVKSSIAHGPPFWPGLPSAMAARPAKRPAPAINMERLPTRDMGRKWARPRLSSNQQTVRLALRNIITIWQNARLVLLPRHSASGHECCPAHRLGARRRGRPLARRVVGAVSAALKLVDLTVAYDRHPAVHHVSAEIPA